MGWDRTAEGFVFRSSHPRAPTAWIEPSPDRTRHVVMENHGEHHPGAESIVVVPDRAVAGVTRFHTTNGQVRFDPNGRWLIIEGVIGFVAVDLIDGGVANHASEGLIGSWSITAGVLEWREAGGGSTTPRLRACPLDEIRARWQPGLGAFADGIFQPDEAFVEEWDAWAENGERATELLPLPDVDGIDEGAFTVEGNRAAGLLALAVVVTVAVVAGMVIGSLYRGGIGSDVYNLVLTIVTILGLAPALVVAEKLVRHPRWIHFGTDTIIMKRVVGRRIRNMSGLTEIKSVQYEGNWLRFPIHVMVLSFSNQESLRIDSDMVARRGVRDMSAMEDVERRIRRLYGHPGSWTATHRRVPELVELTRSAR